MVKNVLVPTDLSDNLSGVIRYAIHFAQKLNASVTFLHVYPLPVPVTDMPVEMLETEEVHQSSLKALRKYMAIWQNEFPGVEFNCCVVPGTVEEGVMDVAEDIDADLIVMALVREKDLEHVIFGHSTVEVINNARKPVLIVPLNAAYADPRNIMLAFDFQKIKNREPFEVLSDIAKLNNAEIKIVHVLKENTPGAEAAASLELEKIFSDIPHSWHFPENGDTVSALEEFIDRNAPDLVALMHHSRGFVRRLFSTQHTKELMKTVKAPLLVLEE